MSDNEGMVSRKGSMGFLQLRVMKCSAHCDRMPSQSLMSDVESSFHTGQKDPIIRLYVDLMDS